MSVSALLKNGRCRKRLHGKHDDQARRRGLLSWHSPPRLSAGCVTNVKMSEKRYLAHTLRGQVQKMPENLARLSKRWHAHPPCKVKCETKYPKPVKYKCKTDACGVTTCKEKATLATCADSAHAVKFTACLQPCPTACPVGYRTTTVKYQRPSELRPTSSGSLVGYSQMSSVRPSICTGSRADCPCRLPFKMPL